MLLSRTTGTTRLVLIESPFRADPVLSKLNQIIQLERNARYAHACMLHCLQKGEAPFASHLLYPLVLDDNVPEERIAGIEAGLAWGQVAHATVVYDDFGVTGGMQFGIERARKEHRRVEYRQLPAELFRRVGLAVPVPPLPVDGGIE